jgi:hypothetical protein
MKGIFLIISVLFFSTNSCWNTESVTISKEIKENAYNKDGVSFSYPSKWKIKHDEVISKLGRVITVQDTKDSIFVFSLFPSEVNLSLEEYAKTIETAWKARVATGKDLEFNTNEVTRKIFLESSKGIRLMFLFEKIPYTQDLFLVRGKKKLAVFAIQTTDEKLENVDKDFQMIFDSLKINLEE